MQTRLISLIVFLLPTSVFVQVRTLSLCITLANAALGLEYLHRANLPDVTREEVDLRLHRTCLIAGAQRIHRYHCTIRWRWGKVAIRSL